MKKQLLLISSILIGSFVMLSLTIIKSNTQEPWVVPAKYKKMENPYSENADTDNIGRILFAKHCKSCHGTNGKGDGNKAASINTPIGDFGSTSFKKQTDGEMYYKTLFGRDDMPSFQKKITDEEERWLIVNYIKKF